MCRSKFACLACLLSLLSAAPLLAAQAVAPGDKPVFQAYRRAAPITNWPLKKLRHHIPELKALKPAADQRQLPEVLRGISANLQKFVVNFVDVSALETVDETETSSNREVGTLEWPPARPITQKFCNLILARQEGNTFIPIEDRTGLRRRKEYPRRTYDGCATRDGGL